MEGNLGFWEGNFAKKKNKNEIFCFAKVEALSKCSVLENQARMIDTETSQKRTKQLELLRKTKQAELRRRDGNRATRCFQHTGDG